MKIYNDLDLQGNRLLNVANLPNDLMDIKLLHAKDLNTVNPVLPTYTYEEVTTGVFEWVWTDIASQYQTEENLALCYAYKTSGGSPNTATVAAVSVASFLRESEFKDGLQVNNDGEVSVLIDPSTGSTAGGTKLLTVSPSGIKFNGTELTAEQIAAIAWAIDKREEDLQEEADALFSVDTVAAGSGGTFATAGGIGYYADVQTSATMTVTVTVMFNSVKVVPSNEDDIVDANIGGWTKVEDGVYSKNITGASGTISAQEFEYEVPSGTYAGITCTKNSLAKSISTKYPVYYGWASSKSVTDILWSNAGFHRSTTAVGTAAAPTEVQMTNDTQGNVYFFEMTRSNSTVVMNQSGNPVKDTVISNQSFTSTENNSITMTGYNLYFSTDNFEAGKAPKFQVYIPQ